MANPSGPYPGRQLFIGLTKTGQPCLAYLVTGRSPESRQRKAVLVENVVRIGPLGDVAYDPLRHYTAVKYDNSTSLVALSNGIQTEAIYETYRLLFNVGTIATRDYLQMLLEGANAEPDSLHTPRIGGVITGKDAPAFFVGIKTLNVPAAAYQVAPEAGRLAGMSTYKGNLDTPEPTDPTARLHWLQFDGGTANELAQALYDISAATYKDEDIRVCAVGGIYTDEAWDIAVINEHR